MGCPATTFRGLLLFCISDTSLICFTKGVNLNSRLPHHRWTLEVIRMSLEKVEAVNKDVWLNHKLCLQSLSSPNLTAFHCNVKARFTWLWLGDSSSTHGRLCVWSVSLVFQAIYSQNLPFRLEKPLSCHYFLVQHPGILPTILLLGHVFSHTPRRKKFTLIWSKLIKHYWSLQ